MSNNKDQPKTEENNNNKPKELDTVTNLKVGEEPEKIITNENEIKENKEKMQKNQNITEMSTICFLPNARDNDTINNLNNPNTSEKKPSFMQKTKTWLGKAWTNFKNSKFNIFKGEEMEECLDAHGFPMKIPKRKHNQQPEKKEENKNDTKTINVNNKK